MLRLVLQDPHPFLAAQDAFAIPLAALSALALFAFSLSLPQGWVPHPEYVLPMYLAGAFLFGRAIVESRKTRWFSWLAALALVHVLANAVLLGSIAKYTLGR